MRSRDSDSHLGTRSRVPSAISVTYQWPARRMARVEVLFTAWMRLLLPVESAYPRFLILLGLSEQLPDALPAPGTDLR